MMRGVTDVPTFVRRVFRYALLPVDIVVSLFVLIAFAFAGFSLLFVRSKRVPGTPRAKMLYVGYTRLEEALSKGLLQCQRDVDMTYNPGGHFSGVTVFVPFGKQDREVVRGTVTFVERGETAWPVLTLVQRVLRLARRCLETRALALQHGVVMVGGPHLASIPAAFARLTTPVRSVLFIEAFWEDIIDKQAYMSSLERMFWLFWYKIVYRVFDAYIGAPSFKPDFYSSRGIDRAHIWPYVHQVDAEHLEQQAKGAELPREVEVCEVPMIVAIGRLEAEKCFLDCVHVCAELVKKGCSFRMVIVGDGSERGLLEAEIERLGLKDQLFLVGRLPNSVAFAVAQRAKICFAPYMGSALVEVLLAGCAVVAYDNDPHKSIAGDGPVKFVADRSISAAAEAVADLLRDPEATELCRLRSREYALAKWNRKAVAEAFVAPLMGSRPGDH